jgi:hypothetical protein
MSQSSQAPTPPAAPGADDEKLVSRSAMHRRIAIACGATAGVTFILAGLLAGQSVLPNVLNELRERELLPVHIVGSGGAESGGPGAPGSAGSPGTSGGSDSGGSSPAGGGSDSPGSPGTPASEDDSPGLDDPKGAVDGTLDTLKEFVKDTTGLDLPDLPEVPGVTVPPVTVPQVTVPQVTVPNVTLPPATVPPLTVPPVTVPGVTVPSVTVPSVTVPTVTVPVATTLPPSPASTSLPVSVPTIPTTVLVPVATTLPTIGLP